MLDFQKRIDYEGDLSEVMQLVCDDYQLGEYRKHSIIPVGYEDFNLKLTTSQGIFFIKIFASFRSLKECQDYIAVISRILEAGVAHPKLEKFRTTAITLHLIISICGHCVIVTELFTF